MPDDARKFETCLQTRSGPYRGQATEVGKKVALQSPLCVTRARRRFCAGKSGSTKQVGGVCCARESGTLDLQQQVFSLKKGFVVAPAAGKGISD